MFKFIAIAFVVFLFPIPVMSEQKKQEPNFFEEAVHYTVKVKVRIKYPNAQLVVVGMHMPPNFGPDYTKMFRELFPKLAEVNRAKLIPFLLKGVVLVPDEERLFRSNHPTAEGHKILAENVWEVINPLIGGIQ